MKKESESLIQQSIWMYFNNLYTDMIIHSVPNGISFSLPEKEKIRVLDNLNKIGMTSGVSDLIIHGKNGKCIMVEVKNSTNSQDPNQIKIQSKLEALGGRYILVRSLEDFKTKISNHIKWLRNED